jgi:hypothetical protein
MQWNSARKSFRKALQELARGENPDFSALVARIEILANRKYVMLRKGPLLRRKAAGTTRQLR